MITLITLLTCNTNTNYLEITLMSYNKIIDMNSGFVRILACGCKLDNCGELEEPCIPHHETNFMKWKNLNGFLFISDSHNAFGYALNGLFFWLNPVFG